MIKKIFIFLSFSLIFTSCVSRKRIAYFQNIAAIDNSQFKKYEPYLKPDDLLMILVSAPDIEAAAPFNLPAVGVLGTSNNLDAAQVQARYQTYLIDNSGNIQFPIIGTIQLGGLTRSEAVDKLKLEIKKYIDSPIVNLRIINYKISVMGEVNRPGSFTIETERITLPEALSLAGDLTIYGNRSNVLIVREADGIKTYNFVDITKADFINSPYYYLTQNDLVYIEPNQTRVNSSAVGPNITVGISALSLIITIISIAIR